MLFLGSQPEVTCILKFLSYSVDSNVQPLLGPTSSFLPNAYLTLTIVHVNQIDGQDTFSKDDDCGYGRQSLSASLLEA